MIVADTNLIAYFLIEGTGTEAVHAVYNRDPAWALAPLCRSEYLNVLATTLRAGVLTEDEAHRGWRNDVELFGHREAEPGGKAVQNGAIGARLSAFDAQFVVLARNLGVPLVTADKSLVRARPDVAVAAKEFGAEVALTGEENRGVYQKASVSYGQSCVSPT